MIRVQAAQDSASGQTAPPFVDLPRYATLQLCDIVSQMLSTDVAEGEEQASPTLLTHEGDAPTVIALPAAMKDSSTVQVLSILKQWIEHQAKTHAMFAGPSANPWMPQAGEAPALSPTFPLRPVVAPEDNGPVAAPVAPLPHSAAPAAEPPEVVRQRRTGRVHEASFADLCDDVFDGELMAPLIRSDPATLYHLARLSAFLGCDRLKRLATAALAYGVRAQCDAAGTTPVHVRMQWWWAGGGGGGQGPDSSPLTGADIREGAQWVRATCAALADADSLVADAMHRNQRSSSSTMAAPQ